MSKFPAGDTNLSVGARAAAGEHTCKLLLRPVGEIPGGLWSWWIYVDGNVHSRGPGSLRKDAVHWYASLCAGPHRLVIRNDPKSAKRVESNVLEFRVEQQAEIVIDVSFENEAPRLSL